MHLLLIDHDTKAANDIRAFLKDTHITMEWQRTPADGILSVSRNQPNIIVMGTIFPDLKDESGSWLVTMLRAQNFGNVDAPIIVLTSESEVMSKVHALNAGADDFMTKPFNCLELFARIAAVLRRTTHKVEKPVIGLRVGEEFAPFTNLRPPQKQTAPSK